MYGCWEVFRAENNLCIPSLSKLQQKFLRLPYGIQLGRTLRLWVAHPWKRDYNLTNRYLTWQRCTLHKQQKVWNYSRGNCANRKKNPALFICVPLRSNPTQTKSFSFPVCAISKYFVSFKTWQLASSVGVCLLSLFLTLGALGFLRHTHNPLSWCFLSTFDFKFQLPAWYPIPFFIFIFFGLLSSSRSSTTTAHPISHGTGVVAPWERKSRFLSKRTRFFFLFIFRSSLRGVGSSLCVLRVLTPSRNFEQEWVSFWLFHSIAEVL